MSTATGQERRRRPRIKSFHCQEQITISFGDGGSSHVEASVIDLNDDGLGIEVPCALNAGTPIFVTGVLQVGIRRKELSRRRAEAVRCQVAGEERFLVGVRFVEDPSHGSVAPVPAGAPEPASADRRDVLKSAAAAYYDGLANRNLTNVPYAQDVVLRTAFFPGGERTELQGRSMTFAFFDGIFPSLNGVEAIDTFYNDSLTSICARARISLKSGQILEVTDIFEVDQAGRIEKQFSYSIDPPAI